jgi:hypothetical protein
MAESTDSVLLQIKIQEGTGKKLPEAKKEVESLANSIVGLAKANKQLRDERNKLDITSADGAKRIQELNKLIDENNDLIKQNSSNLEKQRMNVGNYKRGVTDALKELRIGGINVGDVVDKLSKANEDLFQGMIQGYKQSGIAAKLFGTTARTALTATGIGILIAAIVTLIAHWDDVTDAIGLTDKSFQKHMDNADKRIEEGNKLLTRRLELMKAAGIAEADQLQVEIDAIREQIEVHKQLQKEITKQASEDVIKQLDKRKKQYEDEGKAIDDLTHKLNALLLAQDKIRRDKEKADKDAEKKKKEDAEKAAKDELKRIEDSKKKAIEILRKQNEEALKDKIDTDTQIVVSDKITMDQRVAIAELTSEQLAKIREETAKDEEEADDREKVRRDEAFTAVMQTIDNAQFAADTINAISDAKAKSEIKRIQELAEQGIISKESADKQIAKIEKEAFERNKKVSIAQTIIDTIQSAVSAYKAMVGVPFVGPVLAKIAAAVAVATGFAQVAVIKATKFAQGGEFKPKKYAYGGPILVGGRSHAEGGTKYQGEDGNAFEVEKDEGIFILKKSANKEYLSSLNQAHGGKSWGQKTWYAAHGGQIETRDIAARSNQNSAIARILASALANAPRPVVFVEDIRTGVDRAVNIEQNSRVL